MPGRPKTPETPMVNGVSCTVNPVREEVKYKINNVDIPIMAEVRSVFKNFFVLNAKKSTIKVLRDA